MKADGPAIVARSLVKRYGRVVAVAGLDLEVRRGEIYGFLGRNGAGKTTTIRMLLGLIRPTSGRAEVLGRAVGPTMAGWRRGVGCLVETATAYPNLTVRENLEVQRRLTGAPGSALGVVLERLGLGRYADRRADRLSLGNLQRLALARALIHAPAVLVLDEPANALDPAGIVEVRELLRELARERGVTVFMSSHILGEVAHLADRLGIVHEGCLVEELDRAELAARERRFVEIRAGDTEAARAVLESAGFGEVEGSDGALRAYGAVGREAEIARLLVSAGVDLLALAPSREDLERYFLKRTGGPG